MESEILSVMKERDFYRAKVDELKQSIRKLEYDNAELVKSNEEFSARVKDLATKTQFKKPYKRFNRVQ
mgnify:FL=1